MPSRAELIAAEQTPEEIRKFIGVDKFLYQSIDDLVEAVNRKLEHPIKNPCMACMDGNYVSGNITEEKIQQMDLQRQTERGTV
jgi:amidophosphoribosyltransferase